MVKKIALAVSLCGVLSSGAFAASNAYEITPIIGGNLATNRDLVSEPSLLLGLKAGGRLSRNWLAEAGYENVRKTDYRDLEDQSTSLDRVYVNLLYEFVDSKISPYFLLGVGGEKVDNSLFEVDSGFFAQAGVGVRYEVSDSFHLKAELRDIIGGHYRNQLVATLGFTIPIGTGKYEAPKRTYTAPKEETRQEPQEQRQQRFVAAQEPRQNQAQEPEQERFVQTPQETRQDMIERQALRQAGRENTAKGPVNILKADALFDFDSSVVKDYYNGKIVELADRMKNNPNSTAHISGHTDSTGSAAYNKSLSLRRANAVREVFVGHGVERNRLKVQGYGAEQPIADNSTREGRAQNRRVEIEISEN